MAFAWVAKNLQYINYQNTDNDMKKIHKRKYKRFHDNNSKKKRRKPKKHFNNGNVLPKKKKNKKKISREISVNLSITKLLIESTPTVAADSRERGIVGNNATKKMGMSKEEGIKQVCSGGGHIVILGAGASIAATIRNAEKSEKQLPSMNNLIEIVGLTDILKNIPDKFRSNNFETLYSNLYNNNPNSDIIKAIENKIVEYFSSMELPDEPTIYDYLLLSLRAKDAIATFNWDPFLYQANSRIRRFTKDTPPIFFLHGNVAIGWDSYGKRFGPAGMLNPENYREFVTSKLLYPITQKHYNADEFISTQWNFLRKRLLPDYKAVVATIFGFGAPATDVEAVNLLSEAWGRNEERSMEQFEVIDIAPENELRDKWGIFIYGTHYDIVNDYFKSSLAKNPRRTSEAYFCAYQPMTPAESFRESNPVPQNFKTLDELWQWHKPLIEAEKEQ
jgi:hypothetical protein